jgi:hypothetical protein
MNKQQFSISPRILFLIDSLGAFFSFLFLNQILPSYSNELGIEEKMIKLLSLPISVYFIYSGICFLKLKKNWGVYLKIISIANLFYCLLTLSLVFIFWEGVKFLGYAYFIFESILISVLSFIEWKLSV